MAKDLVSRLILQDGFSATTSKYASETKKVESASEQAGAAMEAEEKKARGLFGALQKIQGRRKARVSVDGAKTAEEQTKALEKRLSKLTGQKVTVKATAKVSHSELKKAKSEAKELQRQLKDLTGRKYKISLSGLEGSTGKLAALSGGLAAGAKAGAIGLAAAAPAAATAGAGKLFSKMFTSGSARQAQRTALTHFLGGDTNRATEMMDWATENAAKTQYGAAEVTQATQRAVQVADGDTDKAKRLVSLAEDMASLNPGKTISDAMEALADADVGEMERMKEFGMKISAEDYEAAGGDLFKVKDQKGRTVEDIYAGGTAEGGSTTQAKVGTLLGVFSTALADAGEKMDNSLAPTLDCLIGYAEAAGPVLSDFLDAFGEKAVGTIAGFVDGLMAAKDQLAPFAPLIQGVAELFGGLLGGALKTVGGLFNSVLIPLLGWTGEALSPVLQYLADLFSEMGSSAKQASDMLTGALTSVKDAFMSFRPGDLWETIKSWVGGKASSLFGKGARKGRATGGYAGGLTTINDQGGDRWAESLRLPEGSMVFPAGATRRMIAREIKAAGGGRGTNNISVNVDARGSSMSLQDQYRFRKALVRDLMEAMDNVDFA